LLLIWQRLLLIWQRLLLIWQRLLLIWQRLLLIWQQPKLGINILLEKVLKETEPYTINSKKEIVWQYNHVRENSVLILHIGSVSSSILVTNVSDQTYTMPGMLTGQMER
jgi:hypothetical protein